MALLPTVLVFTCAEYGQANVNLATSYELALAGVNVCIMSFASLQPRVARLQELISRHASHHSAHPSDKAVGYVSFRECKGASSYMDALAKHGINIINIAHSHGISGALEAYSIADLTVFPWSPEEHLAAIESAKEAIASIRPNAVVVEPSFLPAVDACKLVGQKFTLLLPNSIKEVAIHLQPHFAAFWKYPVVSSGFPFPLKWWQIPLNIYLQIRFLRCMAKFANAQPVLSLRKSLGITYMTGFDVGSEAAYICPSLPEIDFPFEVIPDQALLCGPIIMPFESLEESDLALMKWLDNGPTVLINLGSHVVSDDLLARQMATALRILLDHHARKDGRRVQVIWKAKASDDVQKVINDIIEKEIKEEKVKVVAWLEAEPVSILQHPNVVCTVHHGGANSYYEGVWSGIPHILLPVWFDTYDYACRAEYLNIGIFGNKSCAPSVRAEELGNALIRITGDSEEARKFQSTAQQLKEICRARGSGRQLASAAILREAGITK